VLLPGALACADRVNVSAEQWHTLLRRRWDGRLLLLKPRPAGEEYAQPPFAEQATYESFFVIGQASARRARPAAARPTAAAPQGNSDAALPELARKRSAAQPAHPLPGDHASRQRAGTQRSCC
jgi:hypothetical protein